MPKPATPTLLRTLPALALAFSLTAGAAQAQTTATELERRLERLAAELAEVKAQLAAMQQQRATAAPAAAPATPPTTAIPGVIEPAARPAEPATVLGSYGEINYNRPTKATQNTQVDVRRFVLSVLHRFDERTKLVTELEVEHAVVSSSGAGEVALEQAYVERQLSPAWALRAGLFLVPLGLLNENHEPTAFHGVERNFVETAIIPSTWREGGVQLVGAFDNGVTLQGGLATSFDLTKWDATSGEGRESPPASVHQELALAKGRDLAWFGAVNWRGVPGLLLGGGVFSGGATQGQAVASARVTLWDLHARWTPGRWDLAALYSRGSISNTARLNAPLVGHPTLIPARFDGSYVQTAYRLWRNEGLVLTPFVRWERFNTASRYADLGPGLTPSAGTAERVWTVGATLQVAPGVVVKADSQRFGRDKDADRVNLGLGWSF